MKLTRFFYEFFESEKSGGLILILCTMISLVAANSPFGNSYLRFWRFQFFSMPVEFWINDCLMTLFFLLVGLEIRREMFIGELSSVKKAMVPVVAAFGGMVVPAAIHFALNRGTGFQHGFGIPMATDIAFSLGILSLLGNSVPASMKVLLAALAIIDDLGAIIVIALFYSNGTVLIYLGLAILVCAGMLALNKMKISALWLYLPLACMLWFFIYRSGIHPTIAGVLMAFVLPFEEGNDQSISTKIEHMLNKPVAFCILPLFALANTAIVFSRSLIGNLTTSNSLGIMLGLFIGKPVGVFLFSVIATTIGMASLPEDLKKKHLFGMGMIAGIGFTMSIFISLLAFTDAETIDGSKIAVLAASLIAGLAGYVWLRLNLENEQLEGESL